VVIRDYIWPAELKPMAGAGKVDIADRLVQILRRARYTLSADWKQHKAYTGVGRAGRYTLSTDPKAMEACDGSPGGITTPHVEKLPRSTPVVEEVTDPAEIATIRAAIAAQDYELVRNESGQDAA
jgi:hypothetical protein